METVCQTRRNVVGKRVALPSNVHYLGERPLSQSTLISVWSWNAPQLGTDSISLSFPFFLRIFVPFFYRESSLFFFNESLPSRLCFEITRYSPLYIRCTYNQSIISSLVRSFLDSQGPHESTAKTVDLITR